jgi:hypothetical protein
MAKKLVRYLLEGNGSVPAFVENGGHWSVGAELVGVSVDEDARHVPATVVRMTRADLIARVVAMDILNHETQEALDAAAKEAMAEAWLEEVGLGDLA